MKEPRIFCDKYKSCSNPLAKCGKLWYNNSVYQEYKINFAKEKDIAQRMDNGLRRMLSYTRRAIDDYDMIDEGEVIAVGVSGGKDSLALLVTLANLAKFHPKHFSVVGIAVDMGWEGTDYSAIQRLCDDLGVPFYIEPSEITHIIFDVRKEKNPCSLCAKLRRGTLNSAAVKHGIKKIALGHHFDDVVETFMLNLFYEGRLGAFQPVTYLSRMDVTLIRPMIYAPEKDIRYFARRAELPVLESKCPADGKTERENMKQFLRDLDKNNKGLKHRIFGALQKSGIDGFRETHYNTYDDPKSASCEDCTDE